MLPSRQGHQNHIHMYKGLLFLNMKWVSFPMTQLRQFQGQVSDYCFLLVAKHVLKLNNKPITIPQHLENWFLRITLINMLASLSNEAETWANNCKNFNLKVSCNAAYYAAMFLHNTIRPNKKVSVFRETVLKILGRVGTHIFLKLVFWKKFFLHFERRNRLSKCIKLYFSQKTWTIF